MKNDHLIWLRQQMSDLRNQNVLDADNEQRLRDYYGLDALANKRKSTSIITIILAAFGGLLVGGGIILIFAHNWEQFGRVTRVVLAFMPLLLAQALVLYCLFPVKKSQAWRETAGALLFCCVPASISIVGQTYHISNDTQSFLTLWFALVLPFVYWLRAQLTAVMMLVLGATLMIKYQSPYWLCLFALVPYYRLLLLDHSRVRAQQFGWAFAIAFAIAVPFVILERSSSQFTLLALTAGAALLYLGGALYEPTKQFRLKPFTNIGAVAMCINALVLTYADVWQDVVFDDRGARAASTKIEWHAQLFDWSLVIGALVLLVLAIRRKNFRVLPLGSVVGVLALMAAMPNALVNPWIMVVIMNAAVIGIGVWYVYLGIHNDSTSQLNLGLLLLMALLSLRFFDQDLTFITRGIAFIFMGLTLIGMNVWQSRRRNV